MKKTLTCAVFLTLLWHLSVAQNPDSAKTNYLYESNALQVLKLSQDNRDQFKDLNILSTTRTQTQKLGQAPATVFVVTEEQIQLRGYQSLLEVLQDLPGVKVDYATDPRYFNTVIMRGLVGMDKFIILLDGVRISSPTNDVIPVIENYPVHTLKQVEVIFGPASALYGADALSGVINLISRDAGEHQRTQISLLGGIYGHYQTSMMLTRQISSKTSLMLAGQYFYDQQPKIWEFYPQDYPNIRENLQTGVFPTLFGDITPKATPAPNPDQDPLRAYNLQGLLRSGRLTLSFFRNQASNPSTLVVNPDNGIYNRGASFGHSLTMLNGTYYAEVGKWQLTSFVIGSEYRLAPISNLRNVFSGMNPAYKYARSWMLKVEQLANRRVSDRVSFTLGLTVERFFAVPRGHDLEYPVWGNALKGIIINSKYPLNPQGIEADFAQLHYTNLGGLAQTQIQAGNHLYLTIGGRYDYNTRYGSTLNPRIGLVWEASSRFSLKALYGTAYLAPSPEVAFGQFGSFFSTDDGRTYQSAFFRLPNPNLAPQQVRTAELGLGYRPNDFLRVGIVGYYSSITGLFRFVGDTGNTNLYNNSYKGWQAGFVEVPINQGRQTNYGLMLQAEVRQNISTRLRWQGYASLSLTDGRVDDEQNASVEIPAVAPIMTKAGVEISWGKASLSVRGAYIGTQRTYNAQANNAEKRQTLSGYLLVNAFAQYHLSNAFSWFLQIRNLTNTRYYNVNLGASPEASIIGAAQVELTNGMPQPPLRLSAGIRLSL